MASDHIYRVLVRTTFRLSPPASGTEQRREVVYCGPSLRDARVAYLREEPRDYVAPTGSKTRKTFIERLEAEPDDIGSTRAVVVDARN